MKHIRLIRGVSAGVLLMFVHSAQASETTGYVYDGLGRLKSTSVSGGPNSNRQSNICLDPAGNRTQYAMAVGSAPACGTAPSSNPVLKNPVIAVSNAATATIVLSTLATTSAPAIISAFTPGAGAGSATLAADRQSVVYRAPSLPTPGMCEPAYVSLFSVPYSVQNAPNGAVMSGVATISVRSAAGPRPRPGQACP